jgi:nucleoside-diphosphate-sugar epimerase
VEYYRDILQYAINLMHSTGKVVYKQPTEFQSKVPVSSFYMDVSKLERLGYNPKYKGYKIFKAMIQEK